MCLDRLDTSSKVLPCQHTFCRKCLLEIVHKHKELRCPECRVLITVKIDDLPPNVLLMRILEGMRNAGGAPKVQRGKATTNQTVTAVHHTNQQLHGTPDRKSSVNKQPATHFLPHQPYAKALYDYEQKEAE